MTNKLKNKPTNKPLGPRTPAKRVETERQSITELLVGEEARPLTARELSCSIGVAEKEVYSHLEHIQRSCRKTSPKTSMMEGKRLVVTPARCSRCAFVFKKRTRLACPGRCPLCRSESIEEPLFSIR